MSDERAYTTEDELKMLAARLGVPLSDEEVAALAPVHRANQELIAGLRRGLRPAEEPALTFSALVRA